MPTIIKGDTGIDKVVDGSITPAKTQVGALPSMVQLNTANGFGTTNTQVRRFSSVTTNQGSDITYTDSATLGATFTVNANGVYVVSYTDQLNTTAANLGVTLNSLASIGSAAAPILCAAMTAAAGVATSCAGGFYLAAGSVIRALASAPSGTSGPLCSFTITRVA